MRTLVIGGLTGIGQEIIRALRMFTHRQVVAPSVDVLDVRDPMSTQAFFDGSDRFDEIVYSAGVNHLMPIGEVNSDKLYETFAVNVIGFINVLDACRATNLSPFSVVAIVSDSATTAMRHSIAYASSKAALAHAIRCAARELAPSTRVNGVSPSIVDDTPMTAAVDLAVPELRGWTAEEARQYEKSLVPMGRRCLKSEVARLVMQVLDGPNFLTGAVIPLTGGK